MTANYPPVAILAGGLATRLRPLTETIPKALIDINGRPFISHQLSLLKRQGIEHIVLCVAYLGEMIRDVLGSGADCGMRIEYSFDGDALLGTGGALRRALPLLGETFFVLYGDSYLPCELGPILDAFHASAMPALMAVMHNADRWDKSNVVFQDGRVVRYDKKKPVPEMQYIDYGLSILTGQAIRRLPPDTYADLGDLFASLASAGQLAGAEVTQRFYEIGSQTGLEEFRDYIARQDVE